MHHGVAPAAESIGLNVSCELMQMVEGRQRYLTLGTPVRVIYSSTSAHLLGVLLGDPRPAELPTLHASNGLCTAAVSAVGTDLLAREDAHSVAVIGAGTQARYHLVALAAIRHLESATVFAPTRPHAESFARETSEVLGITVIAAPSAEHALRSADIVLTATNSYQPVIDGRWLAPGTHITSIAWGDRRLRLRHGVRRRELDDKTLGTAAVVATNSLAQAELDQGGDLYDPLERGVLERSRLVDLGQLLRGDAPGRASAGDVTVFKNCAFVGVADQAIAMLMLQRAVQLGRGQDLAMSPAVDHPFA